MLILASVNGYYSPYSPQTIMEEEAKTLYGDVFTIAERELFKHRLLTLFPKSQRKVLKPQFPSLDNRNLSTAHVLFIQNRGAINGLSLGDSQTEFLVMIRTYQKQKMIQLMVRISSVLMLMK